MRILILIFFSLITILPALAQQKQAAWWFFGDSLNINFNNQPIKADTGILDLGATSLIYSADATISDANGSLLFYSNGLDVMNRDRKVMPNGNLYPTNQALRSHSNLIVEKPGSQSEYYFFSVYGNIFIRQFDLTFNVIDMGLDGGKGDVVSGKKNVKLLSKADNYLAILQHANNIDYWLVVSNRIATSSSKFGCDTLFTYPITAAGIGQPLITTLPFSMFSIIPKLKSSPDSQWLAATNDKGVELFRFNRATGAITHNKSLQIRPSSTGAVRSIAFSTNNKILYSNRVSNQSLVCQFDLSAGNSAAIQNSLLVVDSIQGGAIQDMQLGIDGKLYLLQTRQTSPNNKYSNWLSIIHCPNAKGTACRLQKQGVNLYGRWGGNLLPSLNQTLFRNSDKLQALAIQDTICPGDSVQLSAFGAAADRFRWFPSGVADTVASPYVKPLQTTTYTVVGFSACRQDTAQVTVTVLTDENTKPNLLAVSVDTVDESRVNISYSLQPAVSVDLERKTGNNWQAVTALSLQSTATTDTGLFASEQNYYYRLRSLSQCQSELWSEVHKTVLLQASDQQKEKVMLKWSAYKGWETEPVTYQVWQKTENEQTYQLIPALTTTDTSTIVTTAGIGFKPCFKVKAISSGRQSWSNSVCLEVANLPEFYNIITPNGDSKNDAFIIRNLNLYPNSQLQIFNRWGSQVFSSDNYRNNWQAEKESSGIYFYRFTTQNGSTYKGWVEVVK